jgi:Mn-dependent DtxR family transcriptional regulator
MELLDMIEVGDWPDRGIRLTEFGLVSARAILWHLSTARRQSVT